MLKISFYFVLLLVLLTMLSPSAIVAQSSVYGDVNGDGVIDVGDVVYLINYLFKAGPEPNPIFIGDCNGDDLVDIGDVVYLINYLFKSGPPPINFFVPPDTTDVLYDTTSGYYFISNRIIVGFKEGVSSNVVDSVINSTGGIKVGEVIDFGLFEIEMPDTNLTPTIEQLMASTYIDFAEHDWLARLAQAQPQDSLYNYCQKDGYIQIGAPLAWEQSTGNPDIFVVIMDTGIKRNHEDLSANLSPIKWQPLFSDDIDHVGHGTFAAGLACADSNGLGVVGMAWNSKLISAKVTFMDFGPLMDQMCAIYVAQAFGFLKKYAQTYNKKMIINMSFGAYGRFSYVFNIAVQKMWNSGFVLIAAVGNDGKRIVKEDIFNGFYPACYNEVLAVGAVNREDRREVHNEPDNHWASNWGEKVIAAPDFIWSTYKDGGYLGWGGTSFAAPVVSGLAALIWARHPQFTNQEVIDCIVNSTDRNFPVYPDTFGLGRINAYRAIKRSDNADPGENPFPNPPTWQNPAGLAGDHHIGLFWNAPLLNHDGTSCSDILGYLVYRLEGCQDPKGWQRITPEPVVTNQFTDYNVSNYSPYCYTISAVDINHQEGYWTPVSGFTPTPQYHYVRGYVRNAQGLGLPGVTVSISGGATGSYLTGSDGYYEFIHLSDGLTYTIQPSMGGCLFSPPNRTYSPLNSNQDDQNFVGTSVYYIKGHIRDSFYNGVSGVTVTLSGGASRQYITGSDGYYEFLNLEGGLNYTVTPTKTDWVFSPSSRSYNPLSSNQDNQDFTGTPYWYIKGYVRENGVPMESVWVELSGAHTAYYLTSGTGYYEFLHLEGLLNYTVTPTKVGWYFTPTNRPYNPLDGNKDNQDFDGHEIQSQFYIKGYVRDSGGIPMSGVNVGLSGGSSGSDTTGGSGYYEFLNLSGGLDYSVTPFKAGWGFLPHTRNYNSLNSDQDNQDFTGTLLPSISSMDPRAGLSGTSVTIQGINFGNTQGTSQVIFCNDAVAAISSWSNTVIQCTVPGSATSGYVNVVSDAGKSNPKYFNIGTGRVRWASNFDDLYYNIASAL